MYGLSVLANICSKQSGRRTSIMERLRVFTLMILASMLMPSLTNAATYNLFVEFGATAYSDSDVGVLYDLEDPTAPDPTPSTLRTATLTGSITTDGTIGMLDDHNVLSWSIRLIDPLSPLDVAFDSTTQNIFFEIDYQPPDNLGPVATTTMLNLVIGNSGTEMNFSYQPTVNGYKEHYEVSFGPDKVQTRVSQDGFSSHYYTDYFGTGVSELTMGTISPVPIPAAAWLFASAICVFGYLGKRKAKAQ